MNIKYIYIFFFNRGFDHLYEVLSAHSETLKSMKMDLK